MLWFLLACVETQSETPDELLRAGTLDQAAAAWVRQGGQPVDTSQPAAQALAMLARREPKVLFSMIAEYSAAGALLDLAPLIGLQTLDVSFERWEPLLQCISGALTTPWRVVVARSATPADGDPTTLLAVEDDPPYRNGRIVGSVSNPPPAAPPGPDDPGAALRAGALGAALDANPPARRVTLLASGRSATLAIHTERRDGLWWAISANEAASAATVIAHCTGG